MKRKEMESLRHIVKAGYEVATGGNVSEETSRAALYAGIVKTLISDFTPIAESRAARYTKWAIESGIVSANGETIEKLNQ